MQIKGGTVLHVLKMLLTLGEKKTCGNCQWQEDRKGGGGGHKSCRTLQRYSVASGMEQPLSV